MARARTDLAEIDRVIAQEKNKGRIVDYLELRRNFLRLAVRVAELAERGYRTPDGKLQTYPKVFARAAEYIGLTAPKLLAEVKKFAADPKAVALAIPRPDLHRPWIIQKGNILAGQTPITLHGFLWQYVCKDPTYRLDEVGLNLQSIDPGPNSLLPEPFQIDKNLLQANLVSSFRNQCRMGREWGEAFELHTSPHYLPSWFKPGGEGAYAWMDTDEGKKLLDLMYQAQVKAFGEFSCIKTIDLANEWVFCNQSPEAMSEFHRWLKNRHGSIRKVNELWNTSFNSFGEIPKPFDPKTFFMPVGVYQTRGAFWDWCCFNAERAAAVVQWMNDTAKKRYPGLLTHIKCIFSSFSHRSLAQCFVVGTDPQKMITITDLIGLDGSYTRGNNWKDTLFSYDYMKSICPEKPIFCSEMHAVRYDDPTAPGEIRRGLFQRFIHGERMNMLFLNTTTQVPEWWGNSESGYDWNLSAAPAAFEAFGTASADIRRLTPEICRFAQRKPDVLLFYDNAADFGVPGKDNLSGRYYDRLKPVYESLLYQDVKVGIITEAMLARETPKTGLIVLAGAQYVSDPAVEALKKFIQTGGKLLWLDQNLTFDPYGQKRNPKLLAAFTNSSRVTHLRPSQALLNNFWLKTLKTDFTAAGKDGKPVWGTEIKSADDEKGRPLVFLANTLARPEQIALVSGQSQSTLWTDLVSGRKIDPAKIVLGPNEILLLHKD
jgi:hypothetical protein